MAVCSRDFEAVVCDGCFFMDFDFVCGDARSKRNKLPSNPFLSSWQTDDANSSLHS